MEPGHPRGHAGAVDAIVVVDQVPGMLAPGRGLDQLAPDPGRGGVSGHVEVEQAAGGPPGIFPQLADELQLTAQANAVRERWIGSVRREALAWLLSTGERHLWQVLSEYVNHYNVARPHRSLWLRAPLGGEDSGQPIGEVVCRSGLGGLLHEYCVRRRDPRTDFLHPTPR